MTDTVGEIRPLKPRSGTERLIVAVGLLALAGWVWAFWLAVIPMQLGGNGGQEAQELSCGPPVLFQESSFAQSISDTWNAETARNIAAECADKNDTHLRHALGVIMLVAPVSLLWVWGDVVLRSKAKEQQPVARAE
ncbi:hypothetical protein [Streptomyces sp. NPDC007172]|uniref:hypothetical protein n=1 Tax=Streptomyces sp. NPDC007172 TaxID=3364776 RepID=UPI003680B35C